MLQKSSASVFFSAGAGDVGFREEVPWHSFYISTLEACNVDF